MQGSTIPKVNAVYLSRTPLRHCFATCEGIREARNIIDLIFRVIMPFLKSIESMVIQHRGSNHGGQASCVPLTCPSFVKVVVCAMGALMKTVTPSLQPLLTPC